MLGIEPGASVGEVRDAWRRQVSRWHPDRNPSPDATVRLQEINDAFLRIERGAAPPVTPTCTGPILAGLGGTVFGRAWQRGATASDGVRVSLEIPPGHWSLDRPVTLGIALGDGLAAIVTLMHPGRFRDGDVLAFPRSARAADGTAADLLVTLRIAAPAIATRVSERRLAQA